MQNRDRHRKPEYRLREAGAEHGRASRGADCRSQRPGGRDQTRDSSREARRPLFDRRGDTAEVNMKRLALLPLLMTLAVAQSPQAGNAENGKRLFVKFGCYTCHG